MASATRLPLKSIIFTTSLVLSISVSRASIIRFLVNVLTGPGSYSRIVALLVVLVNHKNLPWAWHFRVFNGILKHCLFTLPNIPVSEGPSSLFLPVITTSHSPLWECDYNLHKSNSTYFSDLDVSRSHLICCLLQPGIDKLHNNSRFNLVLDKGGNAVNGKWGIMLGAVQCSFRREIKPYEGYEIWSRCLCWDRKWIYVVSHFVKKGTVRPSSYILGDGSWFGKRGYTGTTHTAASMRREGDEDVDEKAIFASAISKYVVKLGRLTIHPEVLIQASGMLPNRPGGWATMSGPSGESTPEQLPVVNGHANGSAEGAKIREEEWDWRMIEVENQRGLKFAEHFAALDNLQAEFTGSKKPALGKYRDFLW